MAFEDLSAVLELEDGTKWAGKIFGSAENCNGEIVLQTGLIGHTEALTDPSYARQLLVLTHPLIGNYGDQTNKTMQDDTSVGMAHESDKVSALIVDSFNEHGEHSHSASAMGLHSWLEEHGVPGLSGIDPRALTKHIRESGTMKARIVIEGQEGNELPLEDINKANLVQMVTCEKVQTYEPAVAHVVAVDCGLKNNQLRCLLRRGVKVTRVPYDHDFTTIECDGYFLSSGPGNPETCASTVANIKKVLENEKNVRPIMGIGLGHQLLARATGATTFKLDFGNCDHNQPCVHADTERCLITSQNHGYAVDLKSLPKTWSKLFANDDTNEGMVHETKNYFSVQFHPEHMAGATDSEFLFDIFIDTVKDVKAGKKEKTIKTRIMEHLVFAIEEEQGTALQYQLSPDTTSDSDDEATVDDDHVYSYKEKIIMIKLDYCEETLEDVLKAQHEENKPYKAFVLMEKAHGLWQSAAKESYMLDNQPAASVVQRVDFISSLYGSIAATHYIQVENCICQHPPVLMKL